jgi:uncharacterized protein DUF433
LQGHGALQRGSPFEGRSSAGSRPGGHTLEMCPVSTESLRTEVCHGKPVIRGLRYPVADILQLLAGGMSVE